MIVVDEPGMKPTGFSALLIIKPSAIFDSVDVNEIGRRSLLKSLTVGALGKGGMSVSFQARGTGSAFRLRY